MFEQLLSRIPGSSRTPSGLLLAPRPVRELVKASKGTADLALLGALGFFIGFPWAVYLAG